jgi:predicted dehydrogenase
VHAVATTKSGASGTVTMTFGTQHKSGLEIEIVTTNGVVTWNPKHLTVVGKSDKDYKYDSGVVSEVAAFAKSLDAKTPDPLQSPEEAFADLQMLEGLLESKGQLKSVV